MTIHKISKRMTQVLLLLSVLIVGSVTPAVSMIVPNWQAVVHAADAEGTSGTCSWDITGGVLTIQPTIGESGTLGVLTGNTEWNLNGTRQTINSVEIKPGVIANANSGYLFSLDNCTEITGLKNLNKSSVTNMQYMFANCNALQSLDLSDFKTDLVTNMNHMFYQCRSLKQLDVSSLKTNIVTNMIGMFQNCNQLQQITGLTSFNTSSVNYMSSMFNSCSSLQQLDLSSFDTTNLYATTDTMFMFSGCTSLWELTLGDKYSLYYWAYLPDPVEDTLFDSIYTVNSIKWRLVGSWDAHHPQGDELTAADIITQHNGQGTTDTYVWQGTRPPDPDRQTNAHYNVAPSYTITIPTGITISTATNNGTDNVTLGAHPKLPYAESLITIGVTSTNGWQIKNDHDSTGVTYIFGKTASDDSLSTGGHITFEADGEKDTATVQPVYAILIGSQAGFKYAERYTDTVNYTISTGVPNT
ncbi:MAG: DUF285 domain-containing protein [Lactobacillaceae bacterium]|nr:DUF285 domain-containing protein [Lactobacillaceae bacterium]